MEKRYALICCRVSSKQQVQEGHGLDSQEHGCMVYSKNKGHIFEKVFYDEGVSGAKFDRPAILEAIKYVEENRGNDKKYVIIFDDISRIARDVSIHWRIKAAFHSLGVTFESPNFEFSDTPIGRFVETVSAAQAQLYREQNAEQVKSRQKSRLERGYWPFGGKMFPYHFEKTKEHGQLLCPTEPQSLIVAECLEKFANEIILNQTEMRDFLQEKDLHGGGKEVKKGLPERLIKNIVFFAGYIEFPKWGVERRKGHHQPIINDVILRKIENRLYIKAPRKLCKNKSDIFPLRRLVRCNLCSELLTSSSPTNGSGKKVYRYTCNNRSCKADPKNIKTDMLHNEYIKLLTNISPEKEIIALAEAIANDLWQQKINNLDHDKKSQENNLRLIEDEIDKCVDAAIHATSNLMREKYEAKAETLEKQKNELEGKFDFLDDVNFEDALECVMDFVGTPAKYWEKSDVENKRKIHGLIFPEGLSYDAKNGFGTVKKALPFSINEALCGPKDRQVETMKVVSNLFL